jgi:hypothetical protein
LQGSSICQVAKYFSLKGSSYTVLRYICSASIHTVLCCGILFFTSISILLCCGTLFTASIPTVLCCRTLFPQCRHSVCVLRNTFPSKYPPPTLLRNIEYLSYTSGPEHKKPCKSTFKQKRGGLAQEGPPEPLLVSYFLVSADQHCHILEDQRPTQI